MFLQSVIKAGNHLLKVTNLCQIEVFRSTFFKNEIESTRSCIEKAFVRMSSVRSDRPIFQQTLVLKKCVSINTDATTGKTKVCAL